MLKAGDKLVCKRKIDTFQKFLIDQCYSIRSLNAVKHDERYVSIYLNNFNIDEHMTGYIVFNYDKFSNFYICDYFYTPQEIRKLKLKK